VAQDLKWWLLGPGTGSWWLRCWWWHVGRRTLTLASGRWEHGMGFGGLLEHNDHDGHVLSPFLMSFIV